MDESTMGRTVGARGGARSGGRVRGLVSALAAFCLRCLRICSITFGSSILATTLNLSAAVFADLDVDAEYPLETLHPASWHDGAPRDSYQANLYRVISAYLASCPLGHEV